MVSLDQFKSTYINECNELLADMEARLMQLGENPDDLDNINAIFRCAHSIKGGAGAFGFSRITSFTHELEALLEKMREGKIKANEEIVDVLLKSSDVVTKLVKDAEAGIIPDENFGIEIENKIKTFFDAQSSSGAKPKQEKIDINSGLEKSFRIKFIPQGGIFLNGNEPLMIIRELKKLGKLGVKVFTENIPTLDVIAFDKSYLNWEFTLKTTKGLKEINEVFEFVIDECELVIEEETIKKEEKISQPEQPLKQETKKEKTSNNASIRVDIDKIDRLINMVGEVVITQAMLNAQSRNLPVNQYTFLLNGIEELSQHTRELQEAVMSIRMQAVKSIFSRMPRIVRDIAKELGKDIKLITEGENTEIDKTVIEQLSDPLTHMIRNAADHGIEKPEVRKEKGKNPQGTITLSAYQRGGKIMIEITDDGAGINREKVLSKAKQKNLISENAVLTDQEIDNLVFHPGFSTAEVVSNISGRGVGMDVVKRNIEAIGGNVKIVSNPERGSRFIISLPLTLAILDGMITRVGNESYIIPIANIIETIKPKETDVRKMTSGADVINVRGEFIPIIYLSKLFMVTNSAADIGKGLVVLVENNNTKLGLFVDELLGQQQVVIKSIEQNSDPVEGIGGATILGDGKVSLILDIAKLSNKTEQIKELEVAA